MATIKATIKPNTSALKARVGSSQNVQAQTLQIGPRTNLGDMADIDMSQLAQGSVLIYDESLQVWLAKPIMDDGTYIEGGHY